MLPLSADLSLYQTYNAVVPRVGLVTLKALCFLLFLQHSRSGDLHFDDLHLGGVHLLRGSTPMMEFSVLGPPWPAVSQAPSAIAYRTNSASADSSKKYKSCLPFTALGCCNYYRLIAGLAGLATSVHSLGSKGG